MFAAAARIEASAVDEPERLWLLRLKWKNTNKSSTLDKREFYKNLKRMKFKDQIIAAT
jgi:hypothetical protein